MERTPFFTNEPAARSDSTGTTGSMKVAASTMPTSGPGRLPAQPRANGPRRARRARARVWPAFRPGASKTDLLGDLVHDLRHVCLRIGRQCRFGFAHRVLQLRSTVRPECCRRRSPTDERGMHRHEDRPRRLAGVHNLERPGLLLPVVQDATTTLDAERERERAIEERHVGDPEVHHADPSWRVDDHPDD